MVTGQKMTGCLSFLAFIKKKIRDTDKIQAEATKLNLDARIVAQRMMSTTSKSPIGKPEIVGLYWYTFTGRRCLINPISLFYI